MIINNGDVHPDIVENQENKAMQEQLDNDPAYLKFLDSQKTTDEMEDAYNKDKIVF